MEDIQGLIALIIIVFGVLQIILFFKVWGMTNKVSSIEEKLKKKSGYEYYMLSGEKEKAYNYLKDELLNQLILYLNGYHSDRRLVELANMEIENISEKVKHTGFELPDQLKSGEAFLEYYKEIK